MEASRLGFATRIDERSATVREALRVAFSAASTTRERELDAAF